MTADTCVHLAVGVAIAGLGIDWMLEQARLRRFIETLGPLPHDPCALVLALADQLARRPHPPDVPYLTALLGPLGATASSIIQKGGCCSGTSRLFILALRRFGIPAYQITLHHQTGRAQHCLVEVNLQDRRLIVDPVYGLYYTDARRNPIGLEDLQAGVAVEFYSVGGGVKTGYPSGNYYEFDFKMTKTANWTKSHIRKFAYFILRSVTNGTIDRFRVPYLLEWPQVLLALILVVTLVAWNLVMCLWIRL
ncbi:transglutaminase-like domain-containing protein [Geomesophilobacter sediminis]|uniref:Transglutaminase domain-containing protein n=1 Tax=Geomesophilobacter sediminis TaxID=2798584 RepID=A0A8J7JG71_9BACT|nr:transglutaminase-like domain-containing protein [Geomesophilobacter sediminis]MBJ6725589.1 transglutaminase domain-containing protein [Geomesophilobacter sediminis]